MIKKAAPWKTLSSVIKLDNSRLVITEDTVLLPNGKTSTYLRESPTDIHSVCIIAVNDSGEIAVQREYSYPPDAILWQLPGGSMNTGEAVAAAAIRELAEESGYSARQTKIIGHYYTRNRLSNQKQYVVLCTNLYEHQLPADPDEFIETYWLTKSKIETMIGSGDIENINMLAALNLWFFSG